MVKYSKSKFGKTELSLLVQAISNKNRHVVGFELTVGQGPEGGSLSTGWRNINAANKLVKKGLIELADGHPQSSVFARNGYSIKVSVYKYDLTKEAYILLNQLYRSEVSVSAQNTRALIARYKEMIKAENDYDNSILEHNMGLAKERLSLLNMEFAK